MQIRVFEVVYVRRCVCEGGESGMWWVCAWGVGGCVGVYGGVGVCVCGVCVCVSLWLLYLL